MCFRKTIEALGFGNGTIIFISFDFLISFLGTLRFTINTAIYIYILINTG